MQLKKRMIKPDFHTDTEIGSELPPAGRLLYIGLWQLAEPSGVIENDPVAYKMILFPLDTIKVDKIKDWIDFLVRDQIIPPSMVKRFGKVRPRKYDPEVIDLVKRWKYRRSYNEKGIK